MRTRHARPDDANALTALLEQLGYEHQPQEVEARLAEWLADERGRIVVAEREDAVVGFLAMQVCPYFERPGRFARIVALAVDRHHRGRGVGRRLVDAAHELAIALACSDMEVTSLRSRRDALAFYQALGYTDVCGHSARFKRSIG